MQAVFFITPNRWADMKEIMDSYRVTDRAWELIIARIRELLSQGKRQSDIARIAGCDRATLHRWINDGRGGPNTPFGNMIRTLDRLRIPLADVFLETSEGLPLPSPDRSVTDFDSAIASILRDVATVLGKSDESIARASGGQLKTADVSAHLKGREPMRASDFYLICSALGIDVGQIFTRAVALSADEDGGI